MKRDFSFEITARLGKNSLARTGIIKTPHGEIKTPAFIAVGTKATVKSLTPEQIKGFGAQAVLANAYHLYLQPGHEVVDMAGGLHKFMNWDGPIFTDSGGFQVMSLGVGFKKVIAMNADNFTSDEVIARKKERLAFVDEDGVTFKSHLNGDMHRFTPEVSMQIQHGLGADIIFAFDELTTLMHPRDYQVESLARTHRWAERCITEHERLTQERTHKPYQALFGVIQGANYEDLRREAGRFMGGLPFDGYGIGGALEKNTLGTIVRWVNEELPEDKPKHLLGISEPDDIFAGIENGADTFDCVSPARVGRNGALYTLDGRFNITNARFRRDFSPVTEHCDCYTCKNYTKAYLNHLFKAHELLANTLATIHNEQFIVTLVDDIRKSIDDGSFLEFKEAWLARYYGKN